MSRISFAEWRPLLPGEVERVPQQPGVYELATLVRTVVYIGVGADLGAALTHHLAGAGNPYAPGRRYFRYAVVEFPEQVQRQLLTDFQETHQGVLPSAQATLTPPGGDPRRHLKAV